MTHKHLVSLVIPVYAGKKTLPLLMEEILPLTFEQRSPNGNQYIICEVLLVHDCGPDASDRIIEELSAEYQFVRPVWLTRNFGQHAATLAGMASATGDWIATIDEDGQQAPGDIGLLLDRALAESQQVVYAQPIMPPPHGWLRNLLSRTAKGIAHKLLDSPNSGQFNSFRLIDGEIGRILAAYCGNGIYLDVALSWIAGRIGYCPVMLRHEMARPSGYSYMKLLAHFWHMIIALGTRPLRFITIMGLFSVAIAASLAGYVIFLKMFGDMPIQGWTSLIITIAFFSGCILTALGVIAEYLALSLTIAMGKPLYMVSTKPTRSGTIR
ncbi:glycosyltransferase [Chlorobium sp. BLA1]|uniref:glycosyltransferase n=1 Tax=Candidatus Chlorobium masyuteum TaxID=2716876 RepID=UPI00142373E4|nr:glycosyltransferase [Candidatus Chlorobium masyuteum]NHQ59183.1 glycosyltransferase [Candidatus Chlorobium masyuteum]